MAFNFNANQYEKAFNPSRLCNWQIPKRPSVSPKRRAGATKIIVNERGHLLPGIRKINPWTGTCVPTQLPVSTTNSNNSNEKMGHSPEVLTSWEKRSSHVPVVPYELPTVASVSTSSRRPSLDKENISHKNEHVEEINSAKFSNRTEKTDKFEPNDTQREVDINNTKPSTPHTPPLPKTPSDTSEPLLTNAYSNDLIAKNLKLHNQRHHTLADAIDLTSIRSKKNKLSKSQWLDVESKIDTWVPAIGCKIFKSPGPTQCSKLKVFRPKTTVNPAERQGSVCEKRPKTAPRTKHLSEMDLAIYWDVSMPLLTNNESLDVKEVLPTPKDDSNKCEKIENTTETLANEPAEEQILTETVKEDSSPVPQIKTDEIVQRRNSIKSNSSESGQQEKNRNTRKSVSNLPEATTSDCDPSKLSIKCTKLYASAPNLMDVSVQVNPSNFKTTARVCDACNVKPTYYKPTIPTENYKLAFKAGKPNTLRVDEKTLERLHKARHLLVPKPKMPYTKKNYSIGTLMPPFSVWPRAAGQDYPDHWRLVSIYQHSYKPLETRKVPLIKTVYQ